MRTKTKQNKMKGKGACIRRRQSARVARLKFPFYLLRRSEAIFLSACLLSQLNAVSFQSASPVGRAFFLWLSQGPDFPTFILPLIFLPLQQAQAVGNSGH